MDIWQAALQDWIVLHSQRPCVLSSSFHLSVFVFVRAFLHTLYFVFEAASDHDQVSTAAVVVLLHCHAHAVTGNSARKQDTTQLLHN